MTWESSELLELFGALLNGTLTPEEQARLDRLLREQEKARALYRRYINLHAALRFYHTAAPAANLPPAESRRLEPQRASGPQPRHRAKLRIRRLLALTAGMLVLIGLSWIWVGGQRTFTLDLFEGPVIGTLSAMRGLVRMHGTRRERRAEVGMELHAQDTLIVPADASAVVTLDGTIRVELGPETTLAFSGTNNEAEAKSLYLKSGFLSVEAGPQPPGRPLYVFTPNAQAKVLGTKFTLAAAPQQTHLRVAEGTVALRPGSAGPDVEVPAGFVASVVGDVAMPPRPSRTGEVLLVESLEKSHTPEQWRRFNRQLANRFLSRHVRRLALKVVIKDHRAVQAADLAGRPLVIVSVAEENVGFEDNLRWIGLAEAETPVICLEGIAFPVLGMTGPKQQQDFDWPNLVTRLRFPLPDHPLSRRGAELSAGLASFAWGRPQGEALRIAVLNDHPDRAALFAYEVGKQMIGRKVPARRVGLPLNPAIIEKPSLEFWNLFENAVNWCAEPIGKR